MKKFAYILAAAWLVAACAPKEDNASVPASKIFSASIEQGTRTIALGTSVGWINEPGQGLQDAISIFDHSTTNDKYLYQGETGAVKGDFAPATQASASGSLNYVYAAYPYSSYNALYGEGVIYTYNNPGQYYYPDSFDVAGGNIMAAASESNSLQFWNLVGYLNLRLIGDGSETLEKVRVTSNGGEYLTGDMLVTIAPGQEPQISTYDGENYVFDYVEVSLAGWDLSLDPSTPLDIWLCLHPGVISSGITVTVVATNGAQFTYSSSNPLEIKRGVYKETAPLDVQFPSLNYLGKGEYTDDIACSIYGIAPITVSCDVYENSAAPGLYIISGYQLPLVAAAFGQTEETMLPYEGYFWRNSSLAINACDPDHVFIEEQDYGVSFNSSHGFIDGVTSLYNGKPFSDGTLVDGVITFPTRGLLVLLDGDGYYYGNVSGGFKLVIPDNSVSSPAPAPASVKAPANTTSIKREFNGKALRNKAVDTTNLRSR